MGNEYKTGEEYRDTGSPSKADDEFLSWLRSPRRKTIANMRGIRVLRVQNNTKISGKYACVVIITNTRTTSTGLENPWTDLIDFNNGVILYWGDAKRHKTKELDDWHGNQTLKEIWTDICSGERDNVPPILFFQKPRPGYVKFCGLVVIEGMNIDWFSDDGVPVPNYRIRFAVLAENKINLDWILDRVEGKSDDKSPQGWKDWKKTGRIRRLTPWMHELRTKKEQLPDNPEDDKILEELRRSFDDLEFEKAIVNLVGRIPSVSRIEITRPIKDGGFDFMGTYWLESIRHEMKFKGEVKKWKSGIGPKDLARLVARLERGEFGMFLTTSYYTKQTQEEILSDNYPVKLYSGIDIIGFLKELQLTSGGKLNSDWVNEVKES